MFTAELTLKPVPPFSFDLSARIFENGDRQIRFYEDGKFRQVISVGGKLMLAILGSNGSTMQPRVRAELKANKEISDTDTKEGGGNINSIVQLGLKSRAFLCPNKKRQDPGANYTKAARITQPNY